MDNTRTCQRCGEALTADDGACANCKETALLKAGGDTLEMAFPPGLHEALGFPPKRPGKPVIEGYDLLGEIARGGMGVVYRARQKGVARLVALKMMLPAAVPDYEASRRFELEVEAVARLDHPNIVPIYEVGSAEGSPYFTMKLIEGGSLGAKIKGLSNDHCAGVQIMAAITRAVEYAHQRGILHRDLKPGNILLDLRNFPYLTDFGLAKYANRESSLTMSGVVMGTPTFMAPEQASGRTREITTAADIYSLGAILYLILTGKPPFESDAAIDILRRVVDDEPDRPSSINRHVDRDLETICLKCLEKEPQRRYPSAAALADDLERWLRHEPILARPSTALEQLVKWARRKPVIAGLAAGLTIAVLTGFAATFQQWRQAEAARLFAEDKAYAETKARIEADQQRNRAEEALTRMELTRIEDRFTAGDSTQAILGLADLLRRQPTNHIAAERLLSAITYRNFVLPEPFQVEFAKGVSAVGLHPDGRRAFGASGDRTVRIWDLAARNGGSMVQVRHSAAVLDARISSDGAWLVTASADRTAQIWNFTTGEAVSGPLSHPDVVSQVMFLAGSHQIVTACWDGGCRVWDSVTGKLLATRLGSRGGIRWIRNHPQGALIAIGIEQSVELWDWKSGQLVGAPIQAGSLVHSGSFSPDGSMLAVGCRGGGVVQVWSVADGQPMSPVLPHPREINHVEFSPRGDLLLTASRDGSARVWAVANWRQAYAPLRHDKEVTVARFSPDGERIATASIDGTARIWRTQTGEPETEPMRHPGTATDLALTADGRLLTGSQDRSGKGTARVWNFAAGKPGPLQLNHPSPVISSTVSRSRKLLVTAAEDGILRSWDLQTLLPEGWIQWQGRVKDLGFVGLSDRLAVLTDDGRLGVLDYREGQLIRPNIPIWPGVREMRLATSANVIGAVNHEGEVVVRSSVTGDEMAKLTPDGFPEPVIALAPDGLKVLVLGSKNPRVWDVVTGKPLSPPLPHDSFASRGVFSHDGRRVLTFSAKEAVKVWETSSGELLLTIPAAGFELTDACLTLNGDVAAVGGSDGSVQVWEIRNPRVVCSFSQFGLSVERLAFDPAQARLCVNYFGGVVRLFDPVTGAARSETHQHGCRIDKLHFQCDESRIVVQGEDHSIDVLAVSPAGSMMHDLGLDDLLEVLNLSESEKSQVSHFDQTDHRARTHGRETGVNTKDPWHEWIAWFQTQRSLRGSIPVRD